MRMPAAQPRGITFRHLRLTGGKTMLRLQNLQKTYVPPDGSPARPVVDVESFELAAGEPVALLGTSGSGKTTLLHLLAGILAADAGVIEYDFTQGNTPTKTNLVQLSEAQRDHFRGQHIGYIFQTHHLLPG